MVSKSEDRGSDISDLLEAPHAYRDANLGDAELLAEVQNLRSTVVSLQSKCGALGRELAAAYKLLEEFGLWPTNFRAVWIPRLKLNLSEAAEALYHLDRCEIVGEEVVIEGWIFDPARAWPAESRPAIVVRSAGDGWFIFPAHSVSRPDVAAHFKDKIPDLLEREQSGFRSILPREVWAEGPIEVQIVVRGENGPISYSPLFKLPRP